MHSEEISATVLVGERDRHFTSQSGIWRLELVTFHNLLIWYKLHEATVIRIGVRRRLPSSGRRIVGEGDPDRATFTSVELVPWLVMLVGTFQAATARGSRSTR
jgi:hypothetical protein